MSGWQRGVMRLMGIRNHRVEVVGVTDQTSWYRRIDFCAPELVQVLESHPTAWLRLWAPNPVKGPDAVSQRGYTFVDIDRQAGTFALEFVLHEEAGPAGDWARRASVGEHVEVALTPAAIGLPAGTRSVVLAGDTSALPAINSWLEVIASHIDVSVFVEDGHEDREGLPISPHPRAVWRWVVPGSVRGEALGRSIREEVGKGPGLYGWGAGERTLVKTVRRTFLDLGLDRSTSFTQFYWTAGRSAG